MPLPCHPVTTALLLCVASVLAQAQRRDEIADKPPVLTSFAINATGADTVSAAAAAVTLTHTVVGARPAEYRVSRRADFAAAVWRPYEASLAIRDWYDAAGEPCASTSGLTGRRITLYLQVRAALGEEVRIVNDQRQLQPARVESNVLRATICAVSPVHGMTR